MMHEHPASQPMTAADVIQVRGARVHNLQNLDVEIPRDRLVVITGVSGSGKSSLAFNTLFAEGQRRYLESLSTYTRRFLDQIERPDVDVLEGLPPTLSVEQQVGTPQPRSTVATTTEIYDYLRVLYARAGQPHCYRCGTEISRQSPDAIVDRILTLAPGTRVMLLAPVVRGRKGAHADVLARIAEHGYVRARIDGEIVDVSEPPKLNRARRHDIDCVIDRIIVKEGVRPRLQESVAQTLKFGNETCIVSSEGPSGWEEQLFSSRFACPVCDLSLAEIEPRTFSFNSPYGACPECTGLGVVNATGTRSRRKSSEARSEKPQICPECQGSRLGPVARHVTIGGVAIHELTSRSIAEAAAIVAGWQSALAEGNATSAAGFSPVARAVADRLLGEIAGRLNYLERVGLEYLSLDRPTNTLSGGEFQRARLAASLGSGLIGVCYVLDEPTIGLHPRDAQRLLSALHDLRDQGNSVLVVEHDLELIRQADFLVDLGPGAGREGGRLIAAGTPETVASHPQSLTGAYLAGRREVAEKRTARPIDPARVLRLSGVRLHNLQNLTVEFPLGVFLCITGVSGSGKSSLVIDSLVPQVRRMLDRRPRAEPEGSPLGALEGIENVERLVEVDQSPLGRTSRANPATYSGMWNWVRRVFAQTRDARIRGYTSRRFSFNVAEGRCPACEGQGTRRLQMNFLPDLFVICPECRGARFNPATLEVRFRGKSIADVLNLRIDEAAEFFENVPQLKGILSTFVAVGLGYLTLGQSALTLSGGEAQRVKLATELGKSQQQRTLFVLDEPTTGLHPADIRKLLEILERLVDQGHSVLVIEHQLDVIAAADWILDLGPGGGADGGRLVGNGPPERIAQRSTPTGEALRDWFSHRRGN